jgi:hypothetical protein
MFNWVAHKKANWGGGGGLDETQNILGKSASTRSENSSLYAEKSPEYIGEDTERVPTASQARGEEKSPSLLLARITAHISLSASPHPSHTTEWTADLEVDAKKAKHRFMSGN